MSTYSDKSTYNKLLSIARTAAAEALAFRESIVEDFPEYNGPSVGHLSDAVESLKSAKKFAV